MDTDKKLDTSEAGPSGSAVPKSASRRRLLRAGVGAAPVVLTMVSSPVRAGASLPGKTASAFASVALGATSGNSVKVTACTGDSPKFWLDTHSATWPATCKPGQLGYSYPSCLGVTGSGYSSGSGTLKVALEDKQELHPYLAAAYLNMQNNQASVITLKQLKAMWDGFYGSGAPGYWIPVGSTQWNWTQTKNWLTTCGIVGTT